MFKIIPALLIETPDANSFKSKWFIRRFFCRHSKVEVDEEKRLEQAVHLKRKTFLESSFLK